VAHHDVRLPVANQAGHGAAVLERGHQLAVVDVEHLGLDAEDLGALLHFGVAPPGQRPAGALEVADVAVGHGDELHLVPGRGPQGGHAAGLELGVVGVRAEGDDPERALRPRRRLRRLRGRLRRGDGRRGHGGEHDGGAAGSHGRHDTADGAPTPGPPGQRCADGVG
jgi:hypothetical protein